MSARPNDYWAPRAIDERLDRRNPTKREQLDRRAAVMREKSTSLAKRDAAIRLWQRRRAEVVNRYIDRYE